MKTFKIFANPQGQYDAVKQGWSWPGFFFNIIWALIKKMWVVGIGLIILFLVLGVIEGIVEESYGKETAVIMSAISKIIGFIIAVDFGLHGNKMREKNLISRGYDYKGTINANNSEAAIALWLKENKED